MATRRSTRARTNSQEPAAPAQVKASQRKKQPALAAVRESPAKRSSGAFSGTTAHNSILAPQVTDNVSEQLINGLRDLWDTSEYMLNKILPGQVTLQAIQDLETRLQNAPRHRNDILGQYQKLKDVMEIYPEKPINVITTCLNIFGLSKASELREEPHRPDEILYRANLAYVVGIFTEKLIQGLDDCDFEEMLQFFVQSLFSKVSRSSERYVIGSTSILKPTFELALDLRTQSYITTLLDQIADGETQPDPAENISKAFYSEDGTALLGWGVPGLRSENLTKTQRATIADRIEAIRKNVESIEEDPDLEALRTQFPITDVVCKFFSWARERNAELMKQTPGGPLSIQEAIDAEISRSKAQQDAEDTIRIASTRASSGFAIPSRSAKPKSSKKNDLYNTVRASRNQSRPQSSAAVSTTFTAPTHQSIHVENRQFSRQPDGNVEEEFEPMIFVGDDPEEDDNEIVPSDDANTNPLTPEKTGRLAQAYFEASQQAEKENHPGPSYQQPPRSLFDTQANGRVLEWHSQYQPTQVDKGKRRRDDNDNEEEEYNQQDDEISQAAFQTQIPPAHGPSKRSRNRRPPATTVASGPSRSALVPTQLEHREEPLPTQLADGPPRSQVHRDVSIMAKETVARLKAQKPVQRRVPWSEQETEQLLRLIEMYGTGWSALKEIDKENGYILQGRDQVALKDKARNIKMDFLKAGHPPPPNFDAVALKTADRNRLLELGRDPDIAAQNSGLGPALEDQPEE